MDGKSLFFGRKIAKIIILTYVMFKKLLSGIFIIKGTNSSAKFKKIRKAH